ncbi:MAG: FAD-binding oxidoreductase [Patescibacteria group bacterium]
MAKIVKILTTEFVTHDVKRFVLEKPKGYKFIPGQATDVAINKLKWKKKTHPFTFTSLNEDPDLEFTIKEYPLKLYPDHKGMTEMLHQLKVGDELIVGEPWGTINYKGPGVFIAGGVGITPFISILRDLKEKNKLSGNKLIFSNKTKDDMILEEEFRKMFNPDDLILTLTREKVAGFESGRVDEAFLKKYVKDFHQNFYICGPKPMVAGLKETLANFGAKTDSIVFEE